MHDGFWLGMLSRQTLQAITSSQYQSIQFYSTPAYNFSGLKDWEKDCIEEFFSECKSILVGAAGGGRELIALIQQGFCADGFDCDGHLVQHGQSLLSLVAHQRLESAHLVHDGRLIQALPDIIPEDLGHYDGCIFGWGAYAHLQGRDNRIGLLRQFRSRMKPGAPLMISFQTLYTSRQFIWIYRVAWMLRKVRWARESVELGDKLSTWFEHYFTESEIERELADGGFELIHFSQTGYGHAVARAK